MSVLSTIVAKKTERLLHAKSTRPLRELKAALRDAERSRDFRAAIAGEPGAIRLIAELKKASPSKGLIRKNFDPARIASVYESGPVAAISVLTEEDFFQGRLSFIPLVRQKTTKPLLRKDFLFDEYQLYEARAYGADAVLLIAALLERGQAAEYLQLAGELGLSVLFEVHDEEELEQALSIDAPLIGINNRNLRTLRIDLATTFRLKREIPAGKIVVCESGIRTRDEVQRLIDAGIDAMLIGTSLMEAQDIGKRIDELMPPA